MIHIREPAVVVAILILAGCAGQPKATSTAEPCSVQAQKFIQQVELIVDAWSDASALGASSPKASLSPVVAQLQTIRRSVEDTAAPECAAPVKGSVVAFMDAVIIDYLLFMKDESLLHGERQSETTHELTKKAIEEFGKLVHGEPPYD